MWTLTRPHRQVLGTLLLVLTTVAPTVFVGLTAWRINRPGHRHEVEAELGRRLGMKVSLESVSYPRFGEAVCTGVALWQEEPRQRTKLVEVARADRVRLSRVGRQIVLGAEGLRLSAEGPSQAVAQVGDLLRRAGEADFERVSLTASACEVSLSAEDEGLGYSLRDLAATFRADPGAPALEASYRIAVPGLAPSRCELKLVRDRRGEALRTTLSLRTAEETPLAARVLSPFFDPDDWLGPEARVRGTLTLSQVGSEDWQADFSGELTDVALGSLLGDRVPDHLLSGRATVSIDSAHWGPRPGGASGWVTASGRLSAGPGAISTSLLRALRTEMRFRLPDQLELRPGVVDFQGLGLAFSIREDGEVHLAGGLGEAFGPGTVLLDGEGLTGLAFAPREPGNLIGLRRTLGPPDAGQAILVPATPELQFLDYLPMPARAPRGGAAVAN